MWTDAHAQAAAAPAGDPMIGTLLNAVPFVAMIAIFYFLIIRPQQQRQKQLDAMLKNLKGGDRVLTTGGMYGTVVDVDGARVVLRVGGDSKGGDVRVEFAKSAVTQVVKPGA